MPFQFGSPSSSTDPSGACSPKTSFSFSLPGTMAGTTSTASPFQPFSPLSSPPILGATSFAGKAADQAKNEETGNTDSKIEGAPAVLFSSANTEDTSPSLQI